MKRCFDRLVTLGLASATAVSLMLGTTACSGKANGGGRSLCNTFVEVDSNVVSIPKGSTVIDGSEGQQVLVGQDRQITICDRSS